MKIIRIIFLSVVIFVCGLAIGVRVGYVPVASNQAREDKSEEFSSIMIDTGDDLIGLNDLAISEGDTVQTLLEKAKQRGGISSIEFIDYPGAGKFVDSINGYKSGDNGKYWQYWVNNEYAQVGVDAYFVKNGDVILWKFTSSMFKDF